MICGDIVCWEGLCGIMFVDSGVSEETPGIANIFAVLYR
jgi:hypothetical protein